MNPWINLKQYEKFKLTFTLTTDVLLIIIIVNVNLYSHCKVGFCHNITSRISVFYEVLLMSILTENSNDLTTDHYSDISVLLSSCSDVISAQVPIALREIVKLIRKTGKVEEFSQINCREVSSWLKENSREAADLLDKLLRDYGHRSIKEMDFITETWSMQPEKLLSAIQVRIL